MTTASTIKAPGPWQEEKDRDTFDHAGLACVIHRVPRSGHLFGYVGVDDKHPLYQVSYYSESEALRDRLEVLMHKEDGVGWSFARAIGVLSGKMKPTPGVVFEVHGGLTYSGKSAPSDDRKGLWWFGFDCAHAGDLSHIDSDFGHDLDDVYRDWDFVVAECKKLADQLAEVSA